MHTITRFATKSLALLAVSAGVAGAQVTVSGSTLGCFGIGCVPTSSTSSFTIGGSGQTLQFAGTSFSGTTLPSGGFTVGSFGTFTILPGPTPSTPVTAINTPFTLLFKLTAPGGATSPSTTFAIGGFVGPNSVDISYGPVAGAPFTFTNGAGTVLVDGGQISGVTTTISGRITAVATTVPEPSTYALLATGFVGLAGAVARRRNNAA